MELIVGEIEDEYDELSTDQPSIRALDERRFTLNALTPIEEFNEHFSAVHFSDDDVDTIGGIVMHGGHLPNEAIASSSIRFVFNPAG